jgi:hypothetical protein
VLARLPKVLSVTAILRQPSCHTWIMAAVTFDEWLEAVFNHPLRKPEWYWDDDFDEHWDALGLCDALTVDYMTRLFLGPDRPKRYPLEQIAQGIWFLIGESSPGQSAHTLLKSDVPLQQRVGCVDAITNFFRAFVAPTAPGPADEQKNPFHIACYMWWDIFPTYGSPNVGEADLHGACIKTMAAMLTMTSELCVYTQNPEQATPSVKRLRAHCRSILDGHPQAGRSSLASVRFS